MNGENLVQGGDALEDSSDRKRAEAALAKRERYLAVLVEVQRQLLATRGEDCYNKILSLLGQTIRAARVYLCEIQADAGSTAEQDREMKLHQRGKWCSYPSQCDILSATPLPAFCCPDWLPILSQGAHIQANVADLPLEVRSPLEALHIVSLLMLPLQINGQLWGVISVNNCRSSDCTQLDISFLSAAASAIALHQERHQVKTALRRSSQFLNSIVENAPLALFVKDVQDNFRYVLWNRAAEAIYNLPREAVIGRTLQELPLERTFQDAVQLEDETLLQHRQLIVADEEVHTPDGIIHQRIRKVPLTDAQNQVTHLLYIAEDIAEQKRQEAALKAMVERERATLRVVERIRQTLDIEQIFRTTTEELRHLLNCDRVAIYQFNPDWSGHFVAESVAIGWVSLMQEHLNDPAMMGGALESDRCLVRHWNRDRSPVGPPPEDSGSLNQPPSSYSQVNDVDHSPFSESYRNLLRRFQAKAYLTVPIFQGGSLWGLLASYQNASPRQWQDGDVQLVTHISTQLGIALQQAELLAQTQRQSAELEKARDVAEAANRAKSEFLSHMSHELRTPLNAILGFAQLMHHDRSLSPDCQTYLETIARNGQHLLGLINDVLEMSKIEADRLKLTLSSVDLYHLLDTLEELFQLKAIAKRLTLRFERSADLPQFIATDESKLRQVLINLLSNAIKFTERGSVVLRATLQSVGGTLNAVTPVDPHPPTAFSVPPASPITLVFEIEDTGIGIAPDDLPTLFQPFVQTQSGKQTSDGTGLGLSISRKFIHLMGGDITVDSTYGRGSTFRVESVVTLGPPIAVLPSRRPIALAPGQPTFRILIVEDHWENRQLLLRFLAPLGFEVREATNGQEGVALWDQWEPHLILMDMRMPVMNGYEATQQIKATAKGQSTVIIAVTSSAFEEDRSAVLEIGCDDFIRKPFRENVIFETLAQYLGVQYLYEELAMAAYSPARQPLTPADLAVMPIEWIAQLRHAASGCRDRQIFQLIEQIPQPQATLAAALTALAYEFQFQEILDITTLPTDASS